MIGILTDTFSLGKVHPSWQSIIQSALSNMNPDYLKSLEKNKHWLPGKDQLFNAFSIPFNQVRYVLIGESPYPRAISANGYAFWDNAVTSIWSDKGFSKEVNRATSLRNFIKMLLIAENLLHPNALTQPDIAVINKTALIKSNHELFEGLLLRGFLLLNASLVLSEDSPERDAKAWKPFLHTILETLLSHSPNTKLILLGRIAKKIKNELNIHSKSSLEAEHPYQLSFITNPEVIDLFKPLHLLRKPKTS